MATVSATKAKKILRDGTVRGHPLTTKQKGFFGAIAGGSRMRKMAAGGATARENILEGMKQGGGIKRTRSRRTAAISTRRNAVKAALLKQAEQVAMQRMAMQPSQESPSRLPAPASGISSPGMPLMKDGGGTKNFIQGAIKHPGVEQRAAKRAGMSTQEYMQAHKNVPGTAGKRARLGLTLTKLSRAKDGTAVESLHKAADGAGVIKRHYSEAKQNIIDGMADGGATAYPTVADPTADKGDPAAGLQSVASVFAALGEPGIKALTEGLKNARLKYAQILQRGAELQALPEFARPRVPAFEDILKQEVASYWNTLGQSRAAVGQVPGQAQPQ